MKNFFTDLVFGFGVVVVAIYTRIKDLFKTKGTTMTCMYHDYPYPTDSQAMNAGAGLVQMAINKEARDLACAVDCGTTVARYAAGKVLPHDAYATSMQAVDCPDEESCWKQIAALESSFPTDPPAADAPQMAGAVPWALIFSLVQTLLDYLKQRQ